MLAITVAAIMIMGAVAKLGFIAQLISKPTMIGYMNDLALTILVDQLPKLFGLRSTPTASSARSPGLSRALPTARRCSPRPRSGSPGLR